MEVTQLRLIVEVFALLVGQADGVFPCVFPDRLQFFEYEAVNVKCKEFSGLTEWRVMWKLHKTSPTDSYSWDSSAPSCTMDPAMSRHSGEYWCEDARGNTSDAVNITVTDGSVILEVPARPVVEGYDVILHCKEKSSRQIADFYKDGSPLVTAYENHMTIKNVSKSDEGLYKCSISGSGESPQSWLAVSKTSQAAGRSPHLPSSPPFLLWLGVSLVALLLLLTGLLCRKVSACLPSGKPTPGSRSPVSGEDPVDPPYTTYAVINRQRKKKEPEGSGAGIEPEERTIYSVIH